MSNLEAVIFDVDGTLYPFDYQNGFDESALGRAVHQNTLAFLRVSCGLDEAAAVALYQKIGKDFRGEISLGLESQLGINRYQFFGAAWDIAPSIVCQPNPKIAAAIGGLGVKKAILSAAPRIWVNRVLEHFGVGGQFGELVFSGEPDVRKPKPEAFLQVLKRLCVEPAAALMVGDLEDSDIAPAKALGMQTAKVGSGETAADMIAPTVSEVLSMVKERLL